MTERMTKEGLWSEIQKNSPAATEPTDAIALSELEPVQESVEPTDATTSPDLEPEQPPTEPTSVDVIVPSELEPVQEPVESTPTDATAPSDLEPMQEPTESIEAAIVELPQSEVIPAQEIIGDTEQVGESQELTTPVELPAKNALSEAVRSVAAPRKRIGFDRYTFTGLSSELEKDVIAAVPVLGEMALLGQSTVLYAPPNTGKTLIMLHLLMEAANNKYINISSVYYFNMDDSGMGLLEKVKIAEEFGFQTIAEGLLKNFKVADFNRIIEEMIDSNQCVNVVIILDTLKRFVDLMDKKRASQFTAMIRRFTFSGGTFIGLAHTNKLRNKSGKLVPSGTSDIGDDFDCTYVLDKVREEDGYAYVQFENTKLRGDVAKFATYRYTNDSTVSYNEKVLSVECVNPNEDMSFQEATQQKAEAVIIKALKVAINEGFDSKMVLANSYVANDVGLSRAKMLKIIEQYTGDDITQHNWKATAGAHNKHTLTVLIA